MKNKELEKNDRLRLCRFLDDLFDRNLFVAYVYTHADDKKISDILRSIEKIVSTSMDKALTKEENHFLQIKYGIFCYDEFSSDNEMVKMYGGELSTIRSRIWINLCKLREEENIKILFISLFTPNIFENEFFKIEKYFPKEFSKIYYSELIRERSNSVFEIWKVFEKYDKI